MSISLNGTNGVVFPDLSTQNTAATGFGFKSRIINGAMVIDQRNNGAAVNPAVAGNYYTDRWNYNSTQSSKLSVQQNAGAVTSPTGFTNYLGFTSLSNYSVLTGDAFFLAQYVEGFNTTDLAWGTANATAVTLSFRVYSSLTGTFGGSFSNSAQNRSYPFTYSVPIANTWTTVAVTVPGDTTGTWLTNNGAGLRIFFGLGAGATFSGTAGAWAGATYWSATGAVSVVGTSGATFYITGVQLEKGSTATSFDYRDYGRELIMCQRYGQLLTQEKRLNAASASGTYVDLISFFPMRATPTQTLVSAGTVFNMSQSTISPVTNYSTQSNYVNNTSGDAYITNRVYFLSAEL